MAKTPRNADFIKLIPGSPTKTRQINPINGIKKEINPFQTLEIAMVVEIAWFEIRNDLNIEYWTANPNVPPAGRQLLIAKEVFLIWNAWKYVNLLVVTKYGYWNNQILKIALKANRDTLIKEMEAKFNSKSEVFRSLNIHFKMKISKVIARKKENKFEKIFFLFIKFWTSEQIT